MVMTSLRVRLQNEKFRRGRETRPYPSRGGQIKGRTGMAVGSKTILRQAPTRIAKSMRIDQACWANHRVIFLTVSP